MEDEILEYICRQVSEFPEGCSTVRLDNDGKICFGSRPLKCNFFPKEKFLGILSNTVDSLRGVEYTKNQWEHGRKILCTLPLYHPKIIQLIECKGKLLGLSDEGVTYYKDDNKWLLFMEGLE